MWSDFLTIWRLEWKRNRWLWLGAFALMLGGRIFHETVSGNISAVVKLFLLIIGCLSPVLFVDSLLCHLRSRTLPFLLTLPCSANRFYWITCLGSLFLSLLAVLCCWCGDGRFPTAGPRAALFFLYLIVVISIHALCFFGNIACRDRLGILFGFLLFIALFFLWIPFFLIIKFIVLFWFEANILPPFFYILPLGALTFFLEGWRLWTRFIVYQRSVIRELVRFAVTVVLLPVFLGIAAYGGVIAYDIHLNRYYKALIKQRALDLRPSAQKYPAYFLDFTPLLPEKVSQTVPDTVLAEICHTVAAKGDGTSFHTFSCVGYPGTLKGEYPVVCRYLGGLHSCFGAYFESLCKAGKWREAEEVYRAMMILSRYPEPHSASVLQSQDRVYYECFKVLMKPDIGREGLRMMKDLLARCEQMEYPEFIHVMRCCDNFSFREMFSERGFFQDFASSYFSSRFRDYRRNQELERLPPTVKPRSLEDVARLARKYDLMPHPYFFLFMKLTAVEALRIKIEYLEHGTLPTVRKESSLLVVQPQGEKIEIRWKFINISCAGGSLSYFVLELPKTTKQGKGMK